MTQLTDVLGLFHTNGLVHHDVRQQNIFINPNGLELKLFDFNSAARPYHLERGVDTWNHAPPEYRRGNCQIDFQFDVYQAGIIFRDITHNYDFRKKQLVPSTTLPSRFIEILNRATSKNREGRYRDCREFYCDLKAIG